jgi:hypothetical protein
MVFWKQCACGQSFLNQCDSDDIFLKHFDSDLFQSGFAPSFSEISFKEKKAVFSLQLQKKY